MLTGEQDRDLRRCLKAEAAANPRRKSEFLYDPAAGSVYWFPRSRRPNGVILYAALLTGEVIRCGTNGARGIASPRDYNQIVKLPGIVRARDPDPVAAVPAAEATKPQRQPASPAAAEDDDPFELD